MTLLLFLLFHYRHGLELELNVTCAAEFLQYFRERVPMRGTSL
jgi:hypothetical protein